MTSLFCACVAVVLSACSPKTVETQDKVDAVSQPTGTAFTGATVWSAHLEAPIEDAVLLVEDGRVVDLYPAQEREVPATYEVVVLDGVYVIPGLVSGHGHIRKGPGFHQDEAPSMDAAVKGQLELYASFGITTIKSHGNEPEEAWSWRDKSQNPDHPSARLYMAGSRIASITRASAVDEAKFVLRRKPNFIKLAVDDNLGRKEKMPLEVAGAVIETSTDQDRLVTAHVVKLDDAKALLELGAGFIAHSVRDKPVDQEFIDLLIEKDVCLSPTLMREIAVFAWGGDIPFIDDPIFLQTAHPQFLEMITSPETKERFQGRVADWARSVLPTAIDNMMAIHRGGGVIAMGADSGPGIRPQGYFERLEMEMMEDAGMTAEAVLVASTYSPAACLGSEQDIGTLQAGRWADFLILKDNPLESVRALRSLEKVYIGGKPFEGEVASGS